MTAREQLERLKRGVVEVISEAELLKKLETRRPLVIKAGFDPTAPDLHLGHTVLLRKLRQFQERGDIIVFLIGDATALIGDPSGQSKTRQPITLQEVEANAGTYYSQINNRKILLDIDRPGYFKKLQNSEWFGRPGHTDPFGLKELLELTSKYTVARLIERDDFQKRLKAGQEISVSELLYPLMQGYDSVKIAERCDGHCDVELGGTDQKFNLLVGRDLQRSYGQEPQVVMTMPLLEGTDGVQKMSKSLGNHIGITELPGDMFGKLMSIPDTLIVKYFTLLTDRATAWLVELEQQLTQRSINPRDAKADLAQAIVAMYHDEAKARQAREGFFSQFSRKETPEEMSEIAPAVEQDGTVNLVAVLVGAGLAATKNEARRLLTQGAVKLNKEVVKQPKIPASRAHGVLQVGSRHFRKLIAPEAGLTNP